MIAKEKRVVFIVSTAIMLVSLFTIILLLYYSSNNYVAKVGNQKISKAEYNFFLAQVVAQMETAAGLTDTASIKTFWDTKIEGKSARTVAKNRALDRAKELKIQLIKASDAKTILSESDNDKINSKIVQAKKLYKKDSDFSDVFWVNANEYESIMKDLMITYKFMQKEKSKIKFTQDELKDFYYKNMQSSDYMTLVHVLFYTIDKNKKPLTEAKIMEAKNRADVVYGRIKQKQDIREIASESSEDPDAKVNGGLFTAKKGESSFLELEDWGFKAKEGEYGKIKTSIGYHVVKKPTYEEIKDTDVSDLFKNSKYLQLLETWKKDKKYDLSINQQILNSIKIKR